MKEISSEILIIGSGITGLSIAYELINRGLEEVVVIDKEPGTGRHASGRNSGVLHSGIYYAPGSLKARYCVEGNRLLKEFCLRHHISIIQNGKVIVAPDKSGLKSLYELKKRADSAGATSQIIDTVELKEIEPFAYSYNKALYCPETAVFRPMEVLDKLTTLLISSGKVRILYNTRFDKLLSGSRVKCNNSIIKFNKIVNASGAYSEKIAYEFGFHHRFKVLPFKGTYRKLRKESLNLVNSNVYPVPDLNNPFLGVHFTKSVEGEVYAGPTAIPALSRENYGVFEKLDTETLPILLRDCYMLFTDRNFRISAFNEVKKYFDAYFWKEARLLIPSLKKEDLMESEKVGIRPQLVDWNSKKLEMDFVVLRDSDSIHILNSISPGFTTSMAFAKHIADELETG